MAHSYRVADNTATRSPGLTPSAIKPSAAERIWAAASLHVTSVHAPSIRRWKIMWSGSSRSWLNTELTMLSCSPAVKVAGTLYSHTVLASRYPGGCRSQPSRPPSARSGAYVKLVPDEQHPNRRRDLRRRRPCRSGQGRRGFRELAAVVARSAVDGG